MGVTNNAYRVKKNPVSVNAVYCGKLILSVGRFRSKKLAPLINHLDIGALRRKRGLETMTQSVRGKKEWRY